MGHGVSLERLTDGLYGAQPPAGAASALQSQVSRLRRRLAPHAEIEASPAGYRLVVPPEAVDVHRFEQLTAEGRAALTAGDHPRAAGLLREALARWRGPALPDLPDAHAERTRIEELRPAAVQDRVEADLALGGGAEPAPELGGLPAAHPLGERLYGQLMPALHAGGRPAEALTVYEQARRTLADELGADPSPEPTALHLELAFAEYESRIRSFAEGCQKISGNAGPFFAPATERRIRCRDRMYRLLASRPMAGFFKRLTEKAATGIKLRAYPM
ncbi:BTAD domain-containing putative transcriptional regulator [Streptomyces sp. NPDC051677]|uniref:AfsR/SARP family transcriptional regulator n=1 Tax=Streptomyces sp. NPDC051677 TaxID=3365669 RepID=UPI0037D07DEE